MASEPSTISIGIPQLILCAVIAFVVYRYAVAAAPYPTAPSAPPRTQPLRAARTITPDMIEAVQVMFPQVSASSILWDLEKNGGSLEATTDKIITEGSLPEPPSVNTQRPSSRPTTGTPNTSLPAGNFSIADGVIPPQPPRPKSSYDDLITRYNLQDRLGHGMLQEMHRANASVKNDKASLLLRGRERRDNMILEARKRMETQLQTQANR